MVSQNKGIHIYVCYLPSGYKLPVVLIGLSFQMTTWPEILIELFQKHGYHVLLFDNRDIGLSEKIQANVSQNLVWSLLQYKLGFPVRSPYSLYDMTDDVLGLLDYFFLVPKRLAIAICIQLLP